MRYDLRRPFGISSRSNFDQTKTRTGCASSRHHCRNSEHCRSKYAGQRITQSSAPWVSLRFCPEQARAMHSPMSPPWRALHSPRSRESASGKADASGRSVPESEERRSDHSPLQAPQAPQAAKTYLISPGPQSRNRPTPSTNSRPGHLRLPSRLPTPDPDSENHLSSFKSLSQGSTH